MKSATGVFIQPVHDAQTAGLPQWVRIAHAVRHAAASGAVARGERLPSARQLAQDWRVSRGAVDDAFAQLQLEGLIERRVGDGTYVSAAAPAVAAPPRQAAPHAQRVLQCSLVHGRPISRAESARRSLPAPPMHPRSTDLDAFPLDLWRRLMLRAHELPELLGGTPAGGLPALREAIARHLAIHRGVVCSPEQVLVINGAGEGMQLVGRLLLAPGDSMWIEDPSHASLPFLMHSMGIQVHGVPLDAAGLDVAAGKCIAPQASLCYLHPLTQYPLGVRTRSDRCVELLDWARRSGAWIVEGHMNDELVPAAEQPPSLLAQDSCGRVLMVGTFEGVVFPSLRVAYLILPKALAAAFVAAAPTFCDHVAAPVQWALAEYIDGGHMTAQLGKQRSAMLHRRELVRRALLTTLPPGVRAGPMNSGLTLCLHLPSGIADTDIAARLRSQRVFVEALSTMAWQVRGLNGIALGYGGLDDEQLLQGLRLVGQTLAAASESRPYQPTGENA